MGTTSVDPHVLRFAAQRLDEAADLLDVAVSRHLNGLRLQAAGGSLGLAIGQLVRDVTRWQCAVREYACAVRSSVDRYTDEDRRGAEGLR